MMRGSGSGRKPRQGRLSIDEMARRYQAGESLAVIAAATGLPRSTVQARLKRAGVAFRPASRPQGSGRLDLPVAEIVGRYRAGESAAAIGRSLGVSAQPIRARLIEAGVERRRPGARPRGEDLCPERAAPPAAYPSKDRAAARFGWEPGDVEIESPDGDEPETPFGEEPEPRKPLKPPE